MSDRAKGAPVSGPSWYIVGEAGPELFVPRRSGGIIPKPQGDEEADVD